MTAPAIELAIEQLGGRTAATKTAVDAFHSVKERLDQLGVFGNITRASRLVGQAAHESMRFARLEENLSYSAARLVEVWPSRFKTVEQARPFARNPKALANHVYGDRLGNDPNRPGEGWRYRGRGYIQLTGRSNYASIGSWLGLDLEGDPDRAAEPETAWLIAAAYFNTRGYRGRSCWEWCDIMEGSAGTRNHDLAITMAINGGKVGLADRMQLCAAAERVMRKAAMAERERLP